MATDSSEYTQAPPPSSFLTTSLLRRSVVQKGDSFRAREYHHGIYPNGSRWQAQIMISKITIYLGLFTTQEDAATAYDIAVHLAPYHGKHKLNSTSRT